MSINEDLLPWVWAVQEQIALLDKHDAHWIEEAKRGWSDEEVSTFLTRYGLKRSGRGFFSKEQGGVKKFRVVCERHFRDDPGRDIIKAADRWVGAVNDLSKSAGCNLWSATLKFYWYYHPENLTMYDSYALKGIRRCFAGNGPFDPPDFLGKVVSYYENVAKDKVEKAQKLICRQYPYPLRVVDKYLWWKGSPQKSQDSILANFKAGLRSSGLPTCENSLNS